MTAFKQKFAERKAIRQRRKTDPDFRSSDDQRLAAEKVYQKRTLKEKLALTGAYAEEKSYTLKWRLNWAILIIGFLTAFVYVILFFV